MTLNGLERRNRSYFAFLTEFDCFAGQLRLSGLIWPIMSVNIVSQFQSSTFGHNQPTVRRSRSDIGELLVETCTESGSTAYYSCIQISFEI